MLKVIKVCPQCGLTYLPLHKALIGMIVFFGFGLICTGVVGGIMWLLVESENAKWVGMLAGLIGGGVIGMVKISSILKPSGGGEYCQCTDGA